ncbi:hypothetical protein PHYSODRAFT_323681 [Phytophthora sojae]|uniref:Uncharacterized protein n=1 Tax=Phytophthora sojae (strain P6497) TaxID=1094619 RepID=G4YQK9_PHYSP|nr:hypothetical protein PHYSODRAFT_323681 [Phytophthora sojae]EGZ30273.1 hypothetical protein PHYSODRAFT_323681 [Phytophthora sojae]|eukprot:XP_009517548.1 hypothetical protein PHYSODRAFT_323681 [Phytophthora sojae]
MAVMQECSARLRGEDLKRSPEWNEFLGRSGSDPQFVAQTVSYMNASVDPKAVYNWAETIVSALKQSEMHLHHDIATIATVIESIHQNEVPFSIIVYEIGVLQRVDVLVKDEVSKKIEGHALISAEEVFFRIYIFRSTVTNSIEALFTSPVLPMCQRETKYEELTAEFLNTAHRLTPISSRKQGERTPCTMRPNDLSLILSAARSSYQIERLQAAMWLKDACRDEVNRRTLLALFKEELAGVLCELLQDIDQTTVRFAVYAIKKFAESCAALNE